MNSLNIVLEVYLSTGNSYWKLFNPQVLYFAFTKVLGKKNSFLININIYEIADIADTGKYIMNFMHIASFSLTSLPPSIPSSLPPIAKVFLMELVFLKWLV